MDPFEPIPPRTRSKRPASAELDPDEEGIKKNKTLDEVHEIKLIPKDEAWTFDIPALLDSPTHMPKPEPPQVDGTNFKSYDPQKSIFVLCVVGQLGIQLRQLCFLLPSLLKASSNLQALIVVRAYSTVAPLFTALPMMLPVVEATGQPANHFLKLGLLHPLGGGQQPLDAIVLIDTEGRRRLVIPYGWGAGRQVGDETVGSFVLDTFSSILRESVEALEHEKEKKVGSKKDFYDIARTYF